MVGLRPLVAYGQRNSRGGACCGAVGLQGCGAAGLGPHVRSIQRCAESRWLCGGLMVGEQ